MFKNKYKGFCKKCSQLVEAGEGLCEKENGKWVVFHETCETPENQITYSVFYPYERYPNEEVGEIVKKDGTYYIIDRVEWNYDPSDSNVAYITAHPATEEEYSDQKNYDDKIELLSKTNERINELHEIIQKRTKYEKEIEDFDDKRLCGEPNIYGGGSWFSYDDKYLYSIKNNGADGDDWALSNWDSCIVFRCPVDVEIINEIKQLHNDLKSCESIENMLKSFAYANDTYVDF